MSWYPARNVYDGLKNVFRNISLGSILITGTPDGTKFLRDDGTWNTPSGGASAPGAGMVKSTGSALATATAGTDYVAPSGALGTPASGTLTNCTGLPVVGGGTGAATLTGLVKGNGTSAMTAVTAPSGAVVGTTDTQVITHKDLTDATNTLPTLNPAFLPADYGYISWSYDPIKAYTGTGTLVAGQPYLQLLPIRKATTITNVVFHLFSAGASLTSGQCFAGLFDSSGNLLSATADQSTNWQSVGVKVMALSAAQSVAAGLYYVGWFANGTTMPKLFMDAAASSSVGIGASSPLFTAPRSVSDTTHTGRTTTFPSAATLTPATIPYWVAVS